MMRGLGKRVPGAVQLNVFARDFEERMIALPAREEEGGDFALFFERVLNKGGQKSADVRHRYCASHDAKALLEKAIRDGVLPLWSYFEDGPQEIDYLAVKAIGWHSIASGIFDARDPNNPIDRAPLWLKRSDAEQWAGAVIAGLYPSLIGKPTAPPAHSEGPRRKPGPQANPGWALAIEAAATEFIAAGARRPLRRGEKSAITNRLLNLMSEGGYGDFSDDAARKYAQQVIARLPDS